MTIVGAGPGGISAAIYLRRAGVGLDLVEKGEPGGLLRNANWVENYPGFPHGIGGADLAGLFKQQLEDLGVHVTRAVVTKVREYDRGFVVSAGRRTLRSEAVIVATGTRPKTVGIEGEKRLAGKRLFYSVTDMPDSAGSQNVAVIGGGDAAFDYALGLRGRGHEVKILSRSAPRCLGLLLSRAGEAGIEVITGVTVKSVAHRKGRLTLACSGGGAGPSLDTDLVLIACGREPELGLLDRAMSRRLRVRNGGPATSVPGLYLVGDVVRGDHRQAGIAVGDGIRAAMMVQELLAKKKVRT